MLSAVAIVWTISLLGSGAATRDQLPVPAALIESISGPVEFRSKPDAEPTTLDAKQDLARILFVGEQVRCPKGASLQIRSADKTRQIAGPSDWITIAASSSPRLQALLAEYGRSAGRSRVPPALVFSPTENGVVIPSEFTASWDPERVTSPVVLSIIGSKGQTLWTEAGVASKEGRLGASAARAALEQYRAGQGPGPLVFRMVDAGKQQRDVHFFLVSTVTEQGLRRDLAAWDKEPVALVAHLGRAGVLFAAGFASMAADEYEAALKQAPDSRDLLGRTMQAQDAIGNTPRAEELKKRLIPG